MANNQSYLQQVAQMRQERAQREAVQRLQEIREEYQHNQRERDEAYGRGDRETFEAYDDYCQQLERDWNALSPPQVDPRLTEFARRNAPFLERYGQRAVQALDAAHQYLMRPRNPHTNDPRYTGVGLHPSQMYTSLYFNKMKDLLEMHGESSLGVKYDRAEEGLTPNEAAKASGLTPKQYNQALAEVRGQGRLGTDQK